MTKNLFESGSIKLKVVRGAPGRGAQDRLYGRERKNRRKVRKLLTGYSLKPS